MWKGSQDFVSWLCIISLVGVGAHSDTQPGRGILFAGNASGRLLVLDPARRDGHGGKTVAISDCEPDVTVLEPLLVDKAKKVMVKLSPMLDLSLALNELKTVRAVHIVAVNNECKELLLILQKSPFHRR